MDEGGLFANLGVRWDNGERVEVGEGRRKGRGGRGAHVTSSLELYSSQLPVGSIFEDPISFGPRKRRIEGGLRPNYQPCLG